MDTSRPALYRAALPPGAAFRDRRRRPDGFALLVGLALAATLAACGGSGGDSDEAESGPDPVRPPLDTEPDSCTVAAQNGWVYDNMHDYYLFSEQVPTLDPSDYPSPEALLRDIRFEDRDPFSHITNASEATLEFDEGREFGLGFRFGYEGDDVPPRIVQVQPDSPFGLAGIERGDVIVSIDDVPALEMLLDERYDDYYFDDVLGSREAPGIASWTFRDRDTDEPFTRTIIATEYSIETLSHWDTFTGPGYDGRVGYVALERFLSTSEVEIDVVFAELRDASITDLVLDLRYNRGGRLSVAEKLASLIAGPERRGQLLQRYRYNDKYTDENFSIVVGDVEGLDLRRLVVLVGRETASASEFVISGLDALMDVTVVGEWGTVGKPYIQRGHDRCDQRLNAVEAEGFNAFGNSVFGGIAPDCHAIDGWTRSLGYNPRTDEIEGMLLSGLDLIAFDRCDPFETVFAKRSGLRETPARQGFYPRGGAVR